ncbi:MAG TPA: GAF domain-containing protein, partial [Opitutaceae bacterium]|nr:GAF domain-containing protein [Opitutaceae bacterium]
MDASARSAQLLAEFVAAVSTAETGTAAACAAVERAAEALDADVAAIVCGGELVAAVGYPQGSALVAELAAVRPGVADAWLQVPGAGSCAAAAATLEYPPGATLVLARSGPGAFSREETGLLRGMARVAAMTMRMLDVLDQERSAREKASRLAHEQAALRRVATLVAKAASPEETFSSVAGEVAQLSGADTAIVLRYEADGSATVVGRWGDHGGHLAVGARLTVEGEGAAVSVLRTGRSARNVRFAGPPGSVACAFQRAGVQVGSGSPILVEGRVWGVAIVARAGPEPLPHAAEDRIPAFTELVAAAIANAEARAELRRVADEQAALRRVATLVARASPPTAVFAVVAEEVGRLFPAESTAVGRYDPDGTVTVGSWSRTGEPDTTGTRMPRGGQNVTTLVFETGRPARIDRYAAGDSSAVTATARSGGMRSAIGAPIIVAGRLWGVMALGCPREAGLAPGVDERLAAFAELAATAIANAEARAELRRVADEQAALRRVATLVAQAAPPAELFSTVTEEVGRLLSLDIAGLGRYAATTETLVAAW